MAGWREVFGVAPGFPVGESSFSHDGAHMRGERSRWTPCTAGQPWGALSQLADCKTTAPRRGFGQRRDKITLRKRRREEERRGEEGREGSGVRVLENC